MLVRFLFLVTVQCQSVADFVHTVDRDRRNIDVDSTFFVPTSIHSAVSECCLFRTYSGQRPT